MKKQTTVMVQSGAYSDARCDKFTCTSCEHVFYFADYDSHPKDDVEANHPGYCPFCGLKVDKVIDVQP